MTRFSRPRRESPSCRPPIVILQPDDTATAAVTDADRARAKRLLTDVLTTLVLHAMQAPLRVEEDSSERAPSELDSAPLSPPSLKRLPRQRGGLRKPRSR